MSVNKTKKICVVGAGYWGRNHIRTLYELGSLSGIVESNQSTLAKFQNKYPHAKGFGSLEEALYDNLFDGFIVATPAETHYALAKKIIEAGKSVLVEKPLTLKISDAEELVNLSHEKNISLMVGHVLLFHSAIMKIKEIIESGKIGKLQYIYSNRLNLGQVRTEENVFWSLAPHDISIFQYLINGNPSSIQSTGSSFIQPGIQDSTLTHIKYDNDVEGHIFVSWLHPFKEHRLVVVGSEAMVSFEDSKEDKPLKLYSKKFDLTNGVPEKVDGPVQLVEYEKTMPLSVELNYFLKTIDDKTLEISNGSHALEVIKILVEASNQL